jgi:DNA-binding NarL/FixJ family response regulator
MPRVLLVDDRSLALAGLRSILDGEEKVTVVGEALGGEQALEMVERLRPDVVVIDALAYRIDAVELAGSMVRKFGVDVPAIMLLARVPEDRLLETFRSGVRALLLRQSSSEELVAAVQMVAAGYVLMAPSDVPSNKLRGALTKPCDWVTYDVIEGLTGREVDVLELVAEGLSNSEISSVLSVSESTVKSHVRSTLAKLGLRNRVQLVILAYRLGLAGRHRFAGTDGSRCGLPTAVGSDLTPAAGPADCDS